VGRNASKNAVKHETSRNAELWLVPTDNSKLV
jgi:hypothetical protein